MKKNIFVLILVFLGIMVGGGCSNNNSSTPINKLIEINDIELRNLLSETDL